MTCKFWLEKKKFSEEPLRVLRYLHHFDWDIPFTELCIIVCSHNIQHKLFVSYYFDKLGEFSISMEYHLLKDIAL